MSKRGARRAAAARNAVRLPGFDEGQHPRGAGGRFAVKPGAGPVPHTVAAMRRLGVPLPAPGPAPAAVGPKPAAHRRLWERDIVDGVYTTRTGRKIDTRRPPVDLHGDPVSVRVTEERMGVICVRYDLGGGRLVKIDWSGGFGDLLRVRHFADRQRNDPAPDVPAVTDYYVGTRRLKREEHYSGGLLHDPPGGSPAVIGYYANGVVADMEHWRAGVRESSG